jgi:hypothetical protein
MSKLIPLAALALLLGACSSKPSWTEYKAGPVTMMFPCKPETASATTKCTRSDGSEWRLAVVDKGLTPEEELAQAKEYAEAIPNGQLIQLDAYPVKWRESRRTQIIESWLFYKDGKEYVASVTYTSQQPPELAAEFFSKVNVQ